MPSPHPSDPSSGVLTQNISDNQAGRDINVAARDNIITTYLTGLRFLRPRRVDPELAMPEERFVRPKNLDIAVHAVLPSPGTAAMARVVVLRAPESYGRRSAALRVLAATRVGRDRIFELLPDWDQPDVASLPAERSAGYLLNLRGVTQPLPDQFLKDLTAYAGRLHEADSYLVVTATGSIWPVNWERSLSLISVVDVGLPDPGQIVRNYLASDDSTRHRSSWIDEPESVFNGVLPSVSAPAEAVRLASIIAKAETSKDEERLDEYRGWADRLDRWFSGGEDAVEERAIRIAGSLLNHASASVVLDCADALLSADEINLPRRKGGLLAIPNARQRLKPAGLTFDAKTGTASLVHESQGPAILRYLWTEHTQLSQALTRWLEEISRGPAKNELARLAESVTTLAEAVGVGPVLDLAENWLHDSSSKNLDLVGDLLSDLAVHPSFGSSVRAELVKWATGKTHPARQRAVARAASGKFGAVYTSQALTRLRYILTNASTSSSAQQDAIKAVSELASMPALAPQVVDTLVKWMVLSLEKDAATTMDAFLQVFGYVSKGEIAQGGSPLEVALWMEGPAGDAVRERLLDGWRHIIRQGGDNKAMTRTLLVWRAAAENGRLPQSAVVAFMVALGRDVSMFEAFLTDVVSPEGPIKAALISSLFVELRRVVGPETPGSVVSGAPSGHERAAPEPFIVNRV